MVDTHVGLRACIRPVDLSLSARQQGLKGESWKRLRELDKLFLALGSITSRAQLAPSSLPLHLDKDACL